MSWPWTKTELATLRSLATARPDELMAALPRRTWNAIIDELRKIGLPRKPAQKDWHAICEAHKPRIVLAQAFPAERVWT